MADPVHVDCSTACTVTVVHELTLPPLQLDPEGGALIAGAVLICWAAGFGFRQVIRAIRETEKGDEPDS